MQERANRNEELCSRDHRGLHRAVFNAREGATWERRKRAESPNVAGRRMQEGMIAVSGDTMGHP